MGRNRDHNERRRPRSTGSPLSRGRVAWALLTAAATFGLVGILPAQPALSSTARLHVLFNVSCLSSSDCMGVGQTVGPGRVVDGLLSDIYSILAERWDGARWSVVPSQTPPSPVTLTSLHAVSCVNTRFCMAVGLYSDMAPDGPANEGLVETWDGRTWRIIDSPGGAAALLDVRCLSSTDCIVVGDSTPINGAQVGDVYSALAADGTGPTGPNSPSPGPGSTTPPSPASPVPRTAAAWPSAPLRPTRVGAALYRWP